MFIYINGSAAIHSYKQVVMEDIHTTDLKGLQTRRYLSNRLMLSYTIVDFLEITSNKFQKLIFICNSQYRNSLFSNLLKSEKEREK